jgi:hypothetical protein
MNPQTIANLNVTLTPNSDRVTLLRRKGMAIAIRSQRQQNKDRGTKYARTMRVFTTVHKEIAPKLQALKEARLEVYFCRDDAFTL